ncbi:ABC transporter ATP-binding protein [Devosia naphthalenivorans]|uniref:ABC transporter ATP-binding protein n=1 Tax=Devosia naphthalenivorans TaxID=2082392 RepID=UPI000D38D34C|nr:ABC transporter ATP-binding protein [Devosia naphthalenivorans]
MQAEEAIYSEPAVRLRNITKRYGETLALDAVNLDIAANQVVALLGPNGAGKTTLLHILCTILQPDNGAAEISGFDILRQPLKARKHLGVVFQEPSLDDRLSVYENLDFHGLVYQVPWRLRRQRIDEVLALVELEEWREEMVRSLSSGMKRRLEIARALIHDSRVILLDEPTVGLDVQSRARIWEYLGYLRRTREITVIVTTHYIDEVEECDEVCIIDKGTILAQGSPQALKQTHGRQVLRVTPRDQAADAEIVALFPDAIRNKSDQLLLQSANPQMIDDFLQQFGTRVRQLDIDTASLESVFLSLTGRELRDKPADAREKTFAFGRRGGDFKR